MLFEQEWRAGMQDVSAAIDDVMGELVTVTPAFVSKPNFPAVAQPEKAVTVTAVFTSKAETAFAGGRLRGGQMVAPLVSTSKPIFQFGYGVLPFAILQSFRIMLHRTGETFEVTNVRPDGVSRIEVSVVQLGRQSEER